MTSNAIILHDADSFQRLIAQLAGQIAALHRESVPLRLVGIRSRGVPIAQRLAARLRDLTGTEVPVGAVDITLYRDDIGRRDHWPVLLGTDIPFPVEGADVVLVDGVLFSGRTARAAINAVCDLGRPARVLLAVIVDRDGRELPIQADAAAMVFETTKANRVLVRVRPVDPEEGILLVPAAAEAL